MSNRFKSLVSDNKKEKKDEKKKTENIFKNRFDVLNNNVDQLKEKKAVNNNLKKEKNTRFDSLLIAEEVVQKPIKEPISYKNVIIKETKKEVNYIDNNINNNNINNNNINNNNEVPIIFDSLISNKTLTSPLPTSKTLNFKDKLLTDEPKVKTIIIEQKKIIEVDTEYKKAKRERKAVTNTMCRIVSDMVANGERQRRFYDSIYGQGAYDFEYEKIVDKYELVYGKDSWSSDGEGWLDIIDDYANESDENENNSDGYEYLNGTIDNDNNRYKWL